MVCRQGNAHDRDDTHDLHHILFCHPAHALHPRHALVDVEDPQPSGCRTAPAPLPRVAVSLPAAGTTCARSRRGNPTSIPSPMWCPLNLRPPVRCWRCSRPGACLPRLLLEHPWPLLARSYPWLAGAARRRGSHSAPAMGTTAIQGRPKRLCSGCPHPQR